MKTVPYVLLLLALLGLAVASYDSYAIYNGQVLWCPPPINGCNEVARNPYARILDLPVGYFGVVYYLYMVCLAALLAFDPFSRALRFAAIAYSALGVGFSIYFMHLEVSFIHAFCVYCLVSAITTVLLLMVAVAHARSAQLLAK
ncbi:MAG TPA: vitamin K epoxide reductase family protein [Xanthobacteraceae bacterium]|nr:vitamin K epoxide reductase family protein [Xanthobacteraceae bacterium]